MHLDDQQLALLERFAKTPEGQMLVQVLTARLAATDKELRVLAGEKLLQTQGKAQEMEQMLTYFRGRQRPKQVAPTRSQGFQGELRN